MRTGSTAVCRVQEETGRLPDFPQRGERTIVVSYKVLLCNAVVARASLLGREYREGSPTTRSGRMRDPRPTLPSCLYFKNKAINNVYKAMSKTNDSAERLLRGCVQMGRSGRLDFPATSRPPQILAKLRLGTDMIGSLAHTKPFHALRRVCCFQFLSHHILQLTHLTAHVES